jgi:hypothetical protein
MTFQLCLEAPDDVFCSAPPVFTSTVAVSGAATYQSEAFTPLVPGKYKWRASYSGDSNNGGVGTTSCNDPAAAVVVGSVAGRYTPLTPARILDTRSGAGGVTGPLGPGATVDVQVTGRGGVPTSGVAAVALNVAVTQPTAAGYLTLFAAGSPQPATANVTFGAGQTVPNLVVIKIGAGGKVAMFNSAGTHVIYDVAGWYSDSARTNEGRYQPLQPARIFDTRQGTDGHVRLGAGENVSLQVAGRGAIPPVGAAAAVLNVAVTNTTAPSFLTVYPAGEAQPQTSNLNYRGGDTTSNRVMVKLGSGGKVTVYNNQGSADVVVDASGWYTDSSVSGTAGAYVPLSPARILDTRDGTGGTAGRVGAGAPVEVQVAGRAGVPAIAAAVVLSVAVTQPAAAGYLTVFPAGTAMPLVSDLNYVAGETRSNLVVVRLGAAGRLGLFSSAPAHVVFDVVGWFS